MTSNKKFPCPCCGFKTFAHEANGSFEICPVCFWEDDSVQLADPNYQGGANKVSLKQGQLNFLEFGACEKNLINHVRPAAPDEIRDATWASMT